MAQDVPRLPTDKAATMWKGQLLPTFPCVAALFASNRLAGQEAHRLAGIAAQGDSEGYVPSSLALQTCNVGCRRFSFLQAFADGFHGPAFVRKLPSFQFRINRLSVDL